MERAIKNCGENLDHVLNGFGQRDLYIPAGLLDEEQV